MSDFVIIVVPVKYAKSSEINPALLEFDRLSVDTH